VKVAAALAVLLLASSSFAFTQGAGGGPGAPMARDTTRPPDHTPLDLAHVAAVSGAPRGTKLTGAALEAEAKRISSILRCPVCQGLSVADSPSPMATNIRQQVRELVAAGFDEDQILSYFEASYGEFVRLQPPLRGVNWLVWLAPVLGLVLGLAVVAWVLRSAGGGSAAPAPSDVAEAGPAVVASEGTPEAVDRLPTDPALAQAVLRVREIAYGWPGGTRSGKA
jgi:cytochrome c-type biogenesis protein CcmH